jgi:carboxyl-terminal processing protease
MRCRQKIYNAVLQAARQREGLLHPGRTWTSSRRYKDQVRRCDLEQDLSGRSHLQPVHPARGRSHELCARPAEAGLRFHTNDTYTFDRKNADWPKDQAELDDLWRKRVMNDWLRLKLAGKTDDDIRKTLDKRYASYIDRVRSSMAKMRSRPS